MEWKDQYSVGIQEIDDQHRKLIDLFSTIEKATRLQSGWRDILYGIVALKGYAKTHFDFEEGLMRLYGYSQTVEHEELHRYFFANLEAIANKSHNDAVANELAKFLFDWLTNHIEGADRGYARHILSGAPIVRSKVATPTATPLNLSG